MNEQHKTNEMSWIWHEKYKSPIDKKIEKGIAKDLWNIQKDVSSRIRHHWDKINGRETEENRTDGVEISDDSKEEIISDDNSNYYEMPPPPPAC